jgi:hypothetical protein
MLGASKVTCCKFHTEGPQLYDVTAHNSVARAFSGPVFMHSYVKYVQNV